MFNFSSCQDLRPLRCVVLLNLLTHLEQHLLPFLRLHLRLYNFTHFGLLMVHSGFDSIILKFRFLVYHNLTLVRCISVVVGSELHSNYLLALYNLLT